MSYSPEKVNNDALDRCARELQRFIDLAKDYDLDEMSVQALQTSIEALQFWKAATLRQQAARVDDDAVARAYNALDRYVDEHAGGDVGLLDDGQWNDALRAALEAALSAQPAERQGEAVEVVLRRILERGKHRTDGDLATLLDRVEHMTRGDQDCIAMQRETIRLMERDAAPVGVPDGWREALQGLVDYMHEAGMPCERAERLLAAALSAPQGDRRTNYVSGSVDGSGKFQPTQQDPSAPQGSAQKERK